MADMAMNSLIKIISEKWVKPSSPTPQSRKCYKLSSLDQDMADISMSAAFFYSKQSFHNNYSPMAAAELLETSLSKTLTYYYPFAGRFTDDKNSVDCNDAGAHFLEVQIQASMSEILSHDHRHDPNVRDIDLVFPQDKFPYNNSSSSCHLKIQLNHFQCGGVAIGVCLSHKFGDGKTLCNFVRDWAEIARASPDSPPPPPSPCFSGASIFPPSPNTRNIVKPTSGKRIVSRRFVFSGSKISQLKKMVVDSGDYQSRIQNPSKVEVVTAIIFKSAMAAARTRSGSFSKPCLMSQAGNFRSMAVPPLSENLVGNFVNTFLVTIDEKNHHYNKLAWLVEELRKSKLEFVDRHRKSSEEGKNGGDTSLQQQVLKDWENLINKSRSGRFNTYAFTSFCRFPFYQVDFGWGKPKFVFVTGGVVKNMIILMDTEGGDGIEAVVALEEDEMSIFEHDQELLTFASLNPTISWD